MKGAIIPDQIKYREIGRTAFEEGFFLLSVLYD